MGPLLNPRHVLVAHIMLLQVKHPKDFLSVRANGGLVIWAVTMRAAVMPISVETIPSQLTSDSAFPHFPGHFKIAEQFDVSIIQMSAQLKLNKMWSAKNANDFDFTVGGCG